VVSDIVEKRGVLRSETRLTKKGTVERGEIPPQRPPFPGGETAKADLAPIFGHPKEHNATFNTTTLL
jgi:hypothetical protein